MNIPSQLWPELSRLLDEALNHGEPERAVWLASLAIRQPEMYEPLRRLLAAHALPAASDPLQVPPVEMIAAALAGHPAAGFAPLAAGQMLGSYRLLQPIGEGGMASVWLAEQTRNVLRRVALKIPHQGLEDPESMATRLIHERDLLASLEHPNIARLYDAGLGTGQHPYLAMEWVDGVPITHYANEQRLDLVQRVQLFMQVLKAVRYAHARLVIHRDLKPSNILVTAAGDVKLLDFGVAGLLGDAGGGPLARALTPGAASPEQLAGDAPGTAGDVYALGVVLYELLTGQRPYHLDPPQGAFTASALRAALMAAPLQPPSEAELSAAVAAERATTVHPLRRMLRGDLDAILVRTLGKQASERYESAEALAADLQHWLARKPVTARPANVLYLAGRFYQRNRIAVGASAIAILALCAGLAVSLWQAQRAREQARLERTVEAFLTSLFDANDPQQAQGREITARDLLARGARRLDTELRDQPVLLARLEREIGGLYLQLGDNVDAQSHLKRATALYAQNGLEGSEDGVEAAYELFEAYGEELQIADAGRAAERALALADRNFGPHNRWRLPIRTQQAWMMVSTHAQASVDLMRQALADADRDHPGLTVQKLKGMATLGSGYIELGQFEHARDVFAEVVKEAPRFPAYEATDVLVDRYNLARARYNLREFAAARTELASLVPAMDLHIGPTHDRTVKARGLWAQTIAELGQFAEAVEVERQNVAFAQSRQTTDDEVLSLQRLTLAKLLKMADRPDEGLPLARAGLAFMDAKYREPFWNREVARRLLGELLLEQGKTDAALAALGAAASNSTQIDNFASSPVYADILQAEAMAQRLRAHAGDVDRSFALLGQAQAIYLRILGTGNPAALRCAAHLAWLAALRTPDEAAIARFQQAGSAYAATLPPEHVVHAELLLMSGELARRAGQFVVAQHQLQAGRVAWRVAMGRDYRVPFVSLH